MLKTGATSSLLAAVVAASAGSCSNEPPSSRPPPPGAIASGGNAPGAGGAGGEGGAAGAGAAAMGGGGDAGMAGAGGEGGVCGDGIVNAGESCDGASLGNVSCKDFGFAMGSLACSPTCAFDTSGCSGVESCADGGDNDGDGTADCEDSDCGEVCADSCAAPVVVSDPATLTGDTTGHSSLYDPSCLSIKGTGPEVVYKVTAGTTGMLDIKLASTADLGISVRTSCADASGELGCADEPAPNGVVALATPITKGDTVFIAVDGFGATDAGAYTLEIKSRPVVCGDAAADPVEECDDGNTSSGDGCSAACALEATETEPNNDVADADAHSPPWFAAIKPAGDVDVVSVVVQTSSSSLVASLFDLGDGACAAGAQDSVIDLLASDGATVLTSDDDGGEGLCARASASGLAAGVYFVRVRAADPLAVFPYALDIVQEVCGNHVVGFGEQCDDGNGAPGDGCSPACQLEPTESEPNDTVALADPYKEPWAASISPAADEDVIAVVVPGPSSLLTAEATDNGMGACAAGAVDSFIEILAPDGASVLASDDDTGDGYCAFAAVSGLPAGTYYVRIKAGPLDPSATFGYGLLLKVQ